jgi:hypothetical protein
VRRWNAEEWAANQVAGFPARWARRLLSDYSGKMADSAALPCVTGGRDKAIFDAGRGLCELTERLAKVRLPLDAKDYDICARAEEFAIQSMDIGRIQHPEKVREGMESFVISCQIEPPNKKVKDRPAILRMTCSNWWRRGLRRMHAKAVEGAAIALGIVNRSRECYASDETVLRRAEQNRRNALTLERTIMQNEEGQEFTLADLAEKSTANKSIRRGELMTRIAGFEKIARARGHDGLFLTITCPSRMHKWSSVPGTKKVFKNKKYDESITPRMAQAYLSKIWARMRAKFKREGFGVYGFRIAEPNHDGTPHWHLILFVEPLRFWDLCEVVQGYALNDSPDERGAWRHRVEFVRIDFESGSAAGYIAKYVSKNIDGMHVEKDLLGNNAMHTSARVESWATTWGIRQFQQIGGAAVGVWRELRRIKNLPGGAPEHLVRAWNACNKIEMDAPAGGWSDDWDEACEQAGQVEVRSADFAAYVEAQGGVFCGRDAKIKLTFEQTGELGRYGEVSAPRPVGVETVVTEKYRDGIIFDLIRLVPLLVASVRHVWQVVKRGVEAAVFSPPWTRVNNCTPEKSPPWRPDYFFDIEPDISPGNLGCPA